MTENYLRDRIERQGETKLQQKESKKFVLLFFTILSFCLFTHAQPGAIDPTFNLSDIGFGSGEGASNTIRTTAIQSDGKIIIGGDFITYNGTTRNRVARLNADGSIDATFNPGTGANGYVESISLQSDGKIIIGGNFTIYNGTARNHIARLNADGTLDTSFNPGTGTNFVIYSVVLQSDGKIIIGGNFTSYDDIGRKCIARLNTDGTLDATFNLGSGATGPSSSIQSISLQSDGKIIIGGYFTTYNGTTRNCIARLNSDGTLDTTFNPETGTTDKILSIALQSDNKILIGGLFTAYNRTTRNHIARLNADGSLDATFNPGSGTNLYVWSIVQQSNGKIIIGGNFTTYNGTTRNHIACLNADGTLDVTFNQGTGTNGVAEAISLQSDGKIVVGGFFSTYNGTTSLRIARLNSDGALDATFNPETGANSGVTPIALQSDGKILIGGNLTSYNGTPSNYIARLNADGTLDTSFNLGSGPNTYVSSIALQSDGKIIIGGNFTSYNGAGRNYIARLNADGTLDATFNPGTGTNSGVRSIALQSDGKILIIGNFTSYNGTARNRIARLNNDGTIDATFNPGSGADFYVRSIALQSDGKILIGGYFISYNGTPRKRIARLNADGTLDATFNPGTGADSVVESIAFQGDGKILIGGYFTSYNGTPRNYFARLNADGTLDATFKLEMGASNIVNAITLQNDEKILIGGSFTSYNGTPRNYIARLNADGTLDTSFNSSTGANSVVNSIVPQSDGKIIIGGSFTSYDGIGKNRVARINGVDVATSICNVPNNRLTSSVWPNPTQGKLFVCTNLIGKPYSVFDLSGTLVLIGSSIEAMIDLKDLKPSVYIVNIGGSIFKVVKK